MPKQDLSQERIGYLDIETTNLVADYGYILTWAIKDGSGKTVLSDQITAKDLRNAKAGDEDKRVVQTLIKAISKFDRIITFYGKRFDIPFIRTRAVSMGLDFFPIDSGIYHTDVYDMLKGGSNSRKFKLSSNRLENGCRVLLGKTQKTRIESKYWRGAARGDKSSLAEVMDHNVKDVLDLERLFKKIRPYSKLTKSTL